MNKSESLTTPLGATNLNKMDKALKTIDSEVVSIATEIVSIGSSKADADQLNHMIIDFAYDDKTGVMTLTKYDGTTLVIDTAIEKMAVNFLYDAEREQLIITLEDGILDGGFGEKIARYYGSSKMKVYNYGFRKEFIGGYEPLPMFGTLATNCVTAAPGCVFPICSCKSNNIQLL